MKKTVLNYGLIAGIVVSVWMSISMLVIGCDHGQWGMVLGYTGMLVAFSFIFVAVRHYRDKLNSGSINFGKAFLIGLFISLIASAFYVVTWAIVYHNFMPDFMDKYAAVQIEKAKANGIPAAELRAMTTEMDSFKEMYKQPFWFVVMTLAEILPVGLLISLITAFLLKKRSHLQV